MVQWLGLRASTAGETGSIRGLGTKISTWLCGMAEKKKFIQNIVFKKKKEL